MTQRVLVTGGAGYIGSHTCVEMLQAGYHVTVVDNFSNSYAEVLQRVQRLTGRLVECVRADVCDRIALEDVLRKSGAQAVLHFAGLKAVGESVQQPLRYYENNVFGTMQLLQAMDACNVRHVVFSSSATVYGVPQCLPLNEDHPLNATNPYGQTKIDIERMLAALCRSNNQWRVAVLRYFNPVGAHPSGLIGEDPRGVPQNLMPYIAQVAVGRRAAVHVWGNDYATHDGTGVRDYIHVVDLAQGHIRALEWLLNNPAGPCQVFNLGTGIGFSVLDVVRAFQRVSGRTVPCELCARREGDVPACWADPTRAQQVLGWRASRTLEDMCADVWHWQSRNPSGYDH